MHPELQRRAGRVAHGEAARVGGVRGRVDRRDLELELEPLGHLEVRTDGVGAQPHDQLGVLLAAAAARQRHLRRVAQVGNEAGL
jgi:hypothetical protein